MLCNSGRRWSEKWAAITTNMDPGAERDKICGACQGPSHPQAWRMQLIKE